MSVAANPDPVVQATQVLANFGPEHLIVVITVVWFGWLSWLITKNREDPPLTDEELADLLKPDREDDDGSTRDWDAHRRRERAMRKRVPSERGNRMRPELIASMATDLRDAVPGTVAISGMVYAPEKNGAARSDGYVYRAAVGEELGFGEPVKGAYYPITSLIREVALILPLLEDAMAEANEGKPKAQHDSIPSDYLQAPNGAWTWLLQRNSDSVPSTESNGGVEV